MQRFIVAFAGAAMILAGGCSNKAMEATKTDTSAPISQTAVQQTATTATAAPAASPAPASTAAPATASLPGTTVGEDGALRISVDAASKMLKSGDAVLVDVRTDEQYKTQHAVGALHIPYTQLMSRLNEIPQGKYIIAYCSWPSEHTSARAVLDLYQKGIKNTAALLGGYDAWKEAGLPVEPKE